MPLSLSKLFFFFLLCSLLLNLSNAYRNLIKHEIKSNAKNAITDETQDKFFKIPLRKMEASEENKKKFYDFISQSQSELYTNFLSKTQKGDEIFDIKKVSLINFQNIQVNFYKKLNKFYIFLSLVCW